VEAYLLTFVIEILVEGALLFLGESAEELLADIFVEVPDADHVESVHPVLFDGLEFLESVDDAELFADALLEPLDEGFLLGLEFVLLQFLVFGLFLQLDELEYVF